MGNPTLDEIPAQPDCPIAFFQPPFWAKIKTKFGQLFVSRPISFAFFVLSIILYFERMSKVLLKPLNQIK